VLALSALSCLLIKRRKKAAAAGADPDAVDDRAGESGERSAGKHEMHGGKHEPTEPTPATN